MTEEINKKNKPKFLRRDWHKKDKFGKSIKKNRKWRAAKGRQNKIRLGQRGYAQRPKPGFGENNLIKGKIQNLIPVKIENVKQLEEIKKGQGVIIASVGKKKKEKIIDACNKKKLTILNKYKEIKK